MNLAIAMILAYIPFIWGMWGVYRDEEKGYNKDLPPRNKIKIGKDDAL